jgi:hypothetical protein
MSKFTFAIALVGATFGLSFLTPANALTKADCRPLTADNARECCAAPNWKALITSRDEVICKRPELAPPLALTTPPTATPPETPPPGTEPPTEPPEQTVGINNGHGNLDQNAPGNSLTNNNAENSENSGLGNSGNGGGGNTF